MSDSDRHNRTAAKVVRMIMQDALVGGGDSRDILVLTESIIAGVIFLTAKEGGEDAVLNTLMQQARGRVAAMRAKAKLNVRRAH